MGAEDTVIADLQTKLAEQEAEVLKTKELINLLCSQYGKQPPYKETELAQAGAAMPFAPDEFYGQSLAGSVKKILQQRKSANLGPATPREIYDALIDGGYAFDTENEQNRLTGLRVSLRKASSTFHRLPDGKRYGLLEWYPNAKRKPQKGNFNQVGTGLDGEQEQHGDDHLRDDHSGNPLEDDFSEMELDDLL